MTLTPLKEFRRKRFEELIVERYGDSNAEFERQTGIAQSLASRYRSGKKGIGEEKVADIEHRAGVPGWFDASVTNGTRSTSNGLGFDTNVEDYHQVPLRKTRPVPVVGTAKLGLDGVYEELQHPTGFGDGWLDGYYASDKAYALRVRGDSMHPAIRSGWFIVVEQERACTPGNYVVVSTTDGRKMVKELIVERADEIVLESVNGGTRSSFGKDEVIWMHAVAAICPADSWRPD